MQSLADLRQFPQYDNLEFLARQIVEGFIVGLHRSPFHGFSVEFAEHRLYNKGESTKHIDWKLYARTEKLFVKRYEEETNLRCQIVIDTSSSMLFPTDAGKLGNKLAFAVLSAAAIAYMLRRQRDAVGLTLFSDHIEAQHSARLSSSHTKLLYAELARLLEARHEPGHQKPTRAADSLHQIAENTHKRSLVLLFSDMLAQSADDDELFAALQHLRYNKHEVVLFHVVDRKHEADFAFENRPYKFVDMETGEVVKLSPSAIREHYARSVGDFFNRLKLKCGQYDIDFVPADINLGFDRVLTPYLLKRNKLF